VDRHLEIPGGSWSEDAAAHPFVEAVVTQVAYPLGASREPDPAREREVAERVLALLHSADAAGYAGAEALADNPRLLAALFQNVDLLYEEQHARADAVSVLIMRALEFLEDEERGP
jgi:hypothetical protein